MCEQHLLSNVKMFVNKDEDMQNNCKKKVYDIYMHISQFLIYDDVIINLWN